MTNRGGGAVPVASRKTSVLHKQRTRRRFNGQRLRSTPYSDGSSAAASPALSPRLRCVSGFVATSPDYPSQVMVYLTSESPVELKFSSFQVMKLVCVVLGGPLLLMELAFLFRGVGAEVVYSTNQKPVEADEVVNFLEHKMLDRGV